MRVICLFIPQEWKIEYLLIVFGSLYAFDAAPVYLFSCHNVVVAILREWPILADVKFFCWSMLFSLVTNCSTHPKLQQSRRNCKKHCANIKLYADVNLRNQTSIFSMFIFSVSSPLGIYLSICNCLSSHQQLFIRFIVRE